MKRIQSKLSLFFACGLIGSAAAISLPNTPKQPSNYVAHEWGTFTSVQGSDGVLLDWRPLETSRLPKFVYDWTRPGPGRQGAGFLPKGGLVALQRMETPVIYFYSKEQQNVEVSVQFPQGLITEWYPQASQVGPSSNRGIRSGSAHWGNIEILPEKQNHDLAGALPFDSSGSHYFAARETDSDYLRSKFSGQTNHCWEEEKFIFYRGVGNFGSPLRVTLSTGDAAVLENTGDQTIENLFVLQMKDRKGKFFHVASLVPGEPSNIILNSKASMSALETVSSQLGAQMCRALVQAGLYQREAAAMVKTWADSWFQEDGVRVLYLLPRAWTDRTLPLSLQPSPRELVRIMVGRTEVIMPEVQQNLANALSKANQGDSQAREEALAQFRRLGRFGEPALRLATKGARPELNKVGWMLLEAASSKSPNLATVF
jgi:hypothetical protein